MKVTLFIALTVCFSLLGCSNEKNDFITTESGLKYKILKQGMDPVAHKGQEVLIHETTRYTNNALVYSSRNSNNPLKILIGGNQVIKGVDEGIQGMKKGEIRKLIVPPKLSKRMGTIDFPHPDSTLVYEIELIDILKKKPTPIGAQKKLELDTENSIVNWKGFNKLKISGHHGTVQFQKGGFYMDKNRIIGGEFIIDMNTIANVDGGYSESLVEHLKDKDFFETEKYPIAKLEISNVQYNDASNVSIGANLTIKEITQPIEFKAQVTYTEDKLNFKTKFTINRTRWKIIYASGTFFFENLGDNAISDDIEFDVTVISK
ncbi:YceI family protein [Aquimarina sp. 2201CG14-23]|uniref:YceI family protein n=1 Tax=Aquimarina mycalae TaxID=3040073 RepID=UPI002477F83F|nr:YceI family protein [Aquimarina sp. 2201CG14-23]MDH7445550.1 YceI family protein [Aquimarina sp. 2201CG14-23]